MKTIYALFLALGYLTAGAQTLKPSDPEATTFTRNLYNNINNLRQHGYLFGHQDDLAYGMQWKYQPKRSDVKETAGDYPAMYGWELSHIELSDSVNIDTVPFKNIRRYVREVYERGGVNTISWHGTNPLTGKSAWDPTPGTVAAALPGGAKHEVYVQELDKVGDFLLSLKDKEGQPIPILFRPLHELTGGWFWWGSKSSTPNEVKQLFRFTVHYLKDIKHLHNLLYVFNTGTEFSSPAEYMERYPGDDLVDFVSFDSYQRGEPDKSSAFAQELSRQITILEQVASEHHKIPALAEVGYGHVPDPAWWTQVLAKAMSGHQLAYVLLWRNAGTKADHTTEYYVPYTGQASEADFKSYYNLPQTYFNKEAEKMKLYK